MADRTAGGDLTWRTAARGNDEDPDHRFVLGVQWHPEAGDDPALFDALVRVSRDGLR